MEVENIDLLVKLEEYKSIMGSRMADQLDGLVALNRDNIRIKCLEAALKFYISKDGKLISNNVINLAEEFYKFVKGE